MEQKRKLDDRIRSLVDEIYAEHVAVGALPVTEVMFLRELLFRGLEGKHWNRALKIIRNSRDIDSLENNPEDFDEWLPDPVTKMIECSSCGKHITVPLNFKYPLGTRYDTYCHRPKCVAQRKKCDDLVAERRRREAEGLPPHDIPVATISPEDLQSAEVKRIQKEWGVEKIRATRGRTLSALPPIKPIVVKPQRLQHQLTLRQVAALLDIKGFAEAFSVDQVKLYRDYASGNYSQRQLEARVIGKKYPTVHLDNFLDNLIALENAIVIRGLELNRVKPRVHTGMDKEPIRGENEPVKRNAVRLGMGLGRHEEAVLNPQKDFGEIEDIEREKTERKDEELRGKLYGPDS